MKRTIRLTEADLHRVIKECVQQALNEIGDTPRGNFALNAVRGRRAAKHYRNNMNADDEAENNRVMGDAMNKAWENYRENPKLGFNNEVGYSYGFDKGIEKYS